MLHETKTTEWNRDAKRAAEVMAEFRNSTTAPTSKNLDGLMVVIAEELGERGAVYIDWALEGTVGDMLSTVQRYNPNGLGCLGWYPATLADVEMHCEALKKYQCRTDDTNWFRRTPQVDSYLKQVRENIYEAAVVIIDDKPMHQASTLSVKPIRQTSTLLPSIKKKPKQAEASRSGNSKGKKSTRRKPGKNKPAKKQWR